MASDRSLTRDSIARRLRIREVVDAMRARMGQPPWEWPQLEISDARK